MSIGKMHKILGNKAYKICAICLLTKLRNCVAMDNSARHVSQRAEEQDYLLQMFLILLRLLYIEEDAFIQGFKNRGRGCGRRK
jgi:hypothetical protein